MSPIVDVRVAQPSDAGTLVELRRLLFAESEFLLWEPAEFKDTATDEERRINRLNGQPNSRCFVAASGSELVGFLNASGGQANRRRHCATLALAVRKSHWDAGVGTSLMRAAIVWSQSARLKRLELTVHTENERAIALYKKLGFQIEGVQRASLVVNGRYKDELLMALLNEV